MKRWMKVLATFAVTVTSAGCTQTVLDPVQQDSQSQSERPNSNGIYARAILNENEWVGHSSPTFTQPQIFDRDGVYESDSLLLYLSTQPLSCPIEPVPSTCSVGGWQAIIGVPPDLVRVGTIDLANPRVGAASMQFTSAGCGAAALANYPAGTLEILSAGPSSLTVKISGTSPVGDPSTANIDGTYDIPRCDKAPPDPPPNAALAIKGADLSAGLPSNPTIGDSPDPASLYVFLGTGTQTCSDPLSPLGCDGASHVTLRLPPALQQPGTIDLSDPDVAGSVIIAAGHKKEATCVEPDTTAFAQGTMTIHSIDANGVSFTLLGSPVATSPTEDMTFDGDGLYQATICP